MAPNRQSTSTTSIPGAPHRASFAKISEPLEVPGLLDVQLDSFQWLVGSDKWRSEALVRGEENPEGGLESILRELSPIEDFSGSMSLSFSDPHFEVANQEEGEHRAHGARRDQHEAAPAPRPVDTRTQPPRPPGPSPGPRLMRMIFSTPVTPTRDPVRDRHVF